MDLTGNSETKGARTKKLDVEGVREARKKRFPLLEPQGLPLSPPPWGLDEVPVLIPSHQ